MAHRILMINKNKKDFLRLKSLLEKIDGQPHSLDWLGHWDEVQDSGVFHQYDIILTIDDSKGKMIKPQVLREHELSELKSRFVTMASHEFRTPLTSIVSSAELVEAYMNRGELERASKHIARIKRSVNDLNAILTDLLSLGDLEENKTKAHFKEFNLPDLVADVCEDCEQLLKPGQRIEYRHWGDKKVKLDPRLLKISLINLVSNASKYSSADASILMSSKILPDKMILSITDHGIGIPADDQPRLFDRFCRARNVTNIQGTGLGLYLTKQYVGMMQGTIGFSSELGMGTTFWMEFPIVNKGAG